jgi:peptidoglycan/LPS O-acetylase OafA/YrhL
VLLILALSLPRFGSPAHPWVNGLYEALCVIVVFPIIVATGAGEKQVDGLSLRVARFFGELSYPLYITHYPLIYLYSGWVNQNKIPVAQGALVGAMLLITSVAIAYTCFRLYDVPVRGWLTRRFLSRRGQPHPGSLKDEAGLAGHREV